MIVNIINFFLGFIIGHLLLIQIVSFIVSCILLGLIIYFISETQVFGGPVKHFFDTLGMINISKRRTLKAWKQIQERLKIGTENQLKLAVLEADKILDEILKEAGYPGNNLDERLDQMPADEFDNVNLDELKEARKLKKRIVAEPDFMTSLSEAKIAIDIYGKVFQELELID